MQPQSDQMLTIKQTAERSWRVALDRAWRSAAMRRQFEAECGFSELDQPADDDIESGKAAAYYSEFVPWAARKLGIEEQLPGYLSKAFVGRR